MPRPSPPPPRRPVTFRPLLAASRPAADGSAWRVKRLVNLLNGSTLLGVTVARLGSARPSPGPRGLVLATGWRWAQPRAAAFTVGNVVITPYDVAWLLGRPALLAHEERHTWQYVACLGLPMLPLYGLAAGYSYLRSGDLASRNPFERAAGLVDGGYPTRPRHERLARRG